MKDADPSLEPDSALESAIKEHLGESRLQALQTSFRGKHSTLDDEITQAVIAARRREMSREQRAVFAAMRLLTRGGMRPTRADKDAWEIASGRTPAQAPAPVESAKPAKKKK